MMVAFWIGAALLCAAALGFVMVPLWRQRQRRGRWSLLGSVAAGLLVPSALVLYLGIGTWDGQPTPRGASLPPMAQLVEGLDARLREQPDDPAGWYLLGQSYMSLRRYADARRAFRESLNRDPAPGLELKLALGEAEVLVDPQSLLGEAGGIFEDALELEPDNPIALWYGGLAAMAMERTDVARVRWSRLYALNPPEHLMEVLSQHLDDLGGPLGTSSLESPLFAQVDNAEPVGAAESVDAPGGSDPGGDPGVEIRIGIRLGEGIDAGVLNEPGAALFLFARAPEGGPPVAVIRESVAAIPGELRLSDANNMLPGRSLADFDALTVVARVSLTGQPIEQPGDVYGEVQYRAGAAVEGLEIVVDRVVE